MPHKHKIMVVCISVVLLIIGIFFFDSTEEIPEQTDKPQTTLADEALVNELSSTLDEVPIPILNDIWPPLSQPKKGDLDKMLERQKIRVLTTFSLGSYYIDQGRQQGTVYELSKALEKHIRKQFKDKKRKLKVVIIPVRRDQLIPYLIDGYGDVVIANMTITPQRQELVDFSRPMANKARELLVMGPASPIINSIDDLAGKEIAVREDSSFYETLQELNKKFVKEGKAEIKLLLVDPRLEREDILEMVSLGLLPMTVHDDHIVNFWAQIFTELIVRDDMPLKENRETAFVLRKDNPEFKSLLNIFVDRHKVGTLTGNVIINRYLNNTNWAIKAMAREPFRKLEELVYLFKKYGDQYDFDWLLLASFAFQESRFDNKAKSRAGAIGIMQILPTTAADKLVGIPDISSPETNIHAGTKYLSVLRDQYFSDEELEDFERYLFTMAGYNAGPNRIRRLRKETAERGLDPNKWFGNVEYVVASKVGREPVVYVGNIFKYYVAYKRVINELEERNKALEKTRN
jgi:membrane-bound lytic murein transglycosylase MltF